MALEVIWSVRSTYVTQGGKHLRRYHAVAYRRHARRSDGFPIWRRAHDVEPGPERQKKEQALQDAHARGPVDASVEHNSPAFYPDELFRSASPELEAAWRLGALQLCLVTEAGPIVAVSRYDPMSRRTVGKLSTWAVGIAYGELLPHEGRTPLSERVAALRLSPPPFRFLAALGHFTRSQIERMARLFSAWIGRLHEGLPAPGALCYPSDLTGF